MNLRYCVEDLVIGICTSSTSKYISTQLRNHFGIVWNWFPLAVYGPLLLYEQKNQRNKAKVPFWNIYYQLCQLCKNVSSTFEACTAYLTCVFAGQVSQAYIFGSVCWKHRCAVNLAARVKFILKTVLYQDKPSIDLLNLYSLVQTGVFGSTFWRHKNCQKPKIYLKCLKHAIVSQYDIKRARILAFVYKSQSFA